MKWFKHYSDNHRGQSVQYLLDNLGYFGVFFYYLIYEMCAEKLGTKAEKAITEDDSVFVFHRRVICSASRAKPTTVGRALDAGQSCKLWSYRIDGAYIEITIPILVKLLDSDQKRARLVRAKSATGSRLDLEKEKEKEKEFPLKSPKTGGFKTELFNSKGKMKRQGSLDSFANCLPAHLRNGMNDGSGR